MSKENGLDLQEMLNIILVCDVVYTIKFITITNEKITIFMSVNINPLTVMTRSIIFCRQFNNIPSEFYRNFKANAGM